MRFFLPAEPDPARTHIAEASEALFVAQSCGVVSPRPTRGPIVGSRWRLRKSSLFGLFGLAASTRDVDFGLVGGQREAEISH